MFGAQEIFHPPLNKGHSLPTRSYLDDESLSNVTWLLVSGRGSSFPPPGLIAETVRVGDEDSWCGPYSNGALAPASEYSSNHFRLACHQRIV